MASSTTRDWELVDPCARRIGGVQSDFAPRLTSLEGATVGLLWNGKPNGDVGLRAVDEELRKRVPTVNTVFYAGGMPTEPGLLDQVAEECDVVVGCTSD